jgi:hypothetical protein
MEAAIPFFIALYGQPPGTSMESAHFTLFTKKKKSLKVMTLPPTSANLLQRVLRAHLQVMLWKATGHQAPPDETADITHFGWEIPNGIPVPAIAQGGPAPPKLIDVIRCQCRVHGKKCSTEACGCHKEHLLCTSYCSVLAKRAAAIRTLGDVMLRLVMRMLRERNLRRVWIRKVRTMYMLMVI